jgi:hypothetical protein
VLYRLLQHLQHELGIDIATGTSPRHEQQWRNTLATYAYPIAWHSSSRPSWLDQLLGAFLEGCRACVCEPFWAAAASLSAMGSSDTLGKLPSPMSWALPSRLNRKTHDLLPVADTCR